MSSGHYGDITIDVSSAPYETGFKFNTLPFGGMTIDAGSAVRLSSAGVVIVDTAGARPDPSNHLRGALYVERGTDETSAPDKLWICLKTTATSPDTYAWVQVAVGP